jgi:hypothetical protein
MVYVEFLRVRGMLIWFRIVVAILVALALVGYALSDIHHKIILEKHSENVIELSWLLIPASYIAGIVACIAGSYISSEREHVALSWTKPVSRVHFSLGYLAVDVAAILAAYVVVLVFGELFTLWVMGLHQIRVDANAGGSFLVGLGFVFALYAVVRALGTAFGRGGLFAGMSWAVGSVLVLLAALPLPWVLHALAVAVNFFNPLAYLAGLGGSKSDSVLPLSFEGRLACEWLLVCVATAISIVAWNRLED